MAEESTHHPDPDFPDVYPVSGAKATLTLHQIIANEIKKNGPIPFSRFMTWALYHPELGYYSSDRQKTGKQGDFITSVSVGPCLGIILARRLYHYWLEEEKPSAFDIIEPGAHDGTLARDILDEIQKISETFYQHSHYHLIETSEHLRMKQHDRLTEYHSGKFCSLASMDKIRATQGAVISNELIDALPVELVKFTQGQWRLQMVDTDEQGNFSFLDHTLDKPEMENFFSQLGQAFPDGYTTEFNIGMADFVKSAANALESGLFLTIDYGHLKQDYYHPNRSEGTLQTYHTHQKSDDPLQRPGEIDITAHVDFSRLEKTAEKAGFQSPWFGTQARYLTTHSREWLLEIEKNPQSSNRELMRQFQTLIHPSMLGTRFSVLEMRKSSVSDRNVPARL